MCVCVCVCVWGGGVHRQYFIVQLDEGCFRSVFRLPVVGRLLSILDLVEFRSFQMSL